jgi:hypothetical protein
MVRHDGLVKVHQQAPPKAGLSPGPARGGMEPLEFTSSGGREEALSRLLKERFFTFYEVIIFKKPFAFLFRPLL